jgi:hypothetical protein
MSMISKFIQQHIHKCGRRKIFSASQKGFVMGIQGCMEHAVMTREIIAHAKRFKKNIFKVQIDFSSAFGSVPQKMVDWNMRRMGIPDNITDVVMDVYDGCETILSLNSGVSKPISWTSGTVQGCPLSPVLFNICLEPFLRALERNEFMELGFPIEIQEEGKEDITICVNTAAYADDLILFPEHGDGINLYLGLLAKYCNYTGMRVNVKKCVSLLETYTDGALDKIQDRIYYRQYYGLDEFRNEIWGEKEEVPLQTSSLYLGITIALNREDDAKHGKHILESVKENIDQIGRSRLNLTHRMHAIKTFELQRIDFRMMCGDITQSDLRDFDRWLRGRISGWLHTPGIIAETFLMSWRDGGFTIPSLEERQYTMLVRTMLDMMSTTDIQLLKIMKQFEKEEAAVYDCEIVERDPNSKEEGGGFLRWYGNIPDLRSNAPRISGPIDDDQFYHPGDTELHQALR